MKIHSFLASMCPLCANLAYAHSPSIPRFVLLGHFKLWKLGFEHRDPSLSNLMIDPETKHAVLNDWDLSHHTGFPKSTQPHGERTGTIPFMAVDLLSKDNWEGKIPCLYRHTLKGSFGFYRGCSCSTRIQNSGLISWQVGAPTILDVGPAPRMLCSRTQRTRPPQAHGGTNGLLWKRCLFGWIPSVLSGGWRPTASHGGTLPKQNG